MKFTKPVLFTLAILCSFVSLLTGQQFKLFDINKAIKDSRLSNFITLNNKLYFTFSEMYGGYPQSSLMFYDGVNQPVVVKDFGNVYILDNQIKSYKNKLFLVVEHGLIFELWEYDEINGARLMEDFQYSKCIGRWNPFHLFEFHDKLYFTDADLDHSSAYECKYQKNLWEYDGISSPRLVNHFEYFDMAVFNDKIYLISYDKGYMRLASWDGNAPIEMEPFAFKFINNLTVFNNNLYFCGIDSSGSHGAELWSFNGAGEVKEIMDINPLGSSSPEDFRISNNRLFFTADDGIHGRELWVFDGHGDPHMIADLNSGNSSSFARNVTFYQDKYYFYAADTIIDMHLWSFNDIHGIPVSKVDIPGDKAQNFNLAVYNEKLYLPYHDKFLGPQLWSYDSLNSLSLAHQFIPGTKDSRPIKLKVCNDKLYFNLFDFKDLWEHDGNNDPKRIFHSDIYGFGYPEFLSSFNNKVFFGAYDQTHGYELWNYDGFNPPVIIKDINPGDKGSYPTNGCLFKNRFYFNADDGNHGKELWAYENDAVLVKDILPGASGSNPKDFFALKDKLVFSANDGIHGKELWVYDGISDPLMIKDLNHGISDSFKSILGILNEKLYFIANVRDLGMLLMEYNGNTEPEMRGFIPTNSLLDISKKVLCNNKLYFSLGNDLKSEIWEFDGFNYPELIYSGEETGDLCIYQNKLFFFANDSLHGMEPWVYDGVNKPEMLTDINPGPANSYLSGNNFKVVNNILYFNAMDDKYGNCIWSFDGINELSIVNGYLQLGIDIVGTNNLTSFRNKLYFTARDRKYGWELWSYCPQTTGAMNVSSCGKFVSPSGKYTWSESGIYCDTIANAFGCDSIITISLTITPKVDTSVTQDGNTLTSNASGVTYQWITCNQYPSDIEGATDSVYSATQNGYYAVILSNGECVDTSACYLVSLVNTQDGFGQSFRVYPNPANDRVTIELGVEYEGLRVTVRNSMGELIKNIEYSTANSLDIELGIVPGLYFIEILNKDNNKATFRVIKE